MWIEIETGTIVVNKKTKTLGVVLKKISGEKFKVACWLIPSKFVPNKIETFEKNRQELIPILTPVLTYEEIETLQNEEAWVAAHNLAKEIVQRHLLDIIARLAIRLNDIENQKI